MNKLPQAIIFIGPQGSGKGTQAKILVKKIGAEYIETGAVLRALTRQDTEFGRHVRQLIDNGNMVTDEDIEMILSNRIKSLHPDVPVVFDGVPRRMRQAELLLKELKEAGRNDIVTLHFQLSHDLSIERLMKRRICVVCGRTTTANGNSAQVCEKCGGELVRRKDDAPEFIRLRLQTYDHETLPVVDYLAKHTRFFAIDTSKTIPEVAAEIEKLLGTEHYHILGKEEPQS